MENERSCETESVRPSIGPSVHQSVHSSFRSSVCPSVRLSIHLSISLSIPLVIASYYFSFSVRNSPPWYLSIYCISWHISGVFPAYFRQASVKLFFICLSCECAD